MHTQDRIFILRKDDEVDASQLIGQLQDAFQELVIAELFEDAEDGLKVPEVPGTLYEELVPALMNSSNYQKGSTPEKCVEKVAEMLGSKMDDVPRGVSLEFDVQENALVLSNTSDNTLVHRVLFSDFLGEPVADGTAPTYPDVPPEVLQRFSDNPNVEAAHQFLKQLEKVANLAEV